MCCREAEWTRLESQLFLLSAHYARPVTFLFLMTRSASFHSLRFNQQAARMVSFYPSVGDELTLFF